MPRKRRPYIPEVPCHIISRGNNRETCFYSEDDYLFYLECLADACKRYQVALHAYVLMTNHDHLLMTPATGSGLSQVMQSVGRRYVQYVNINYKRSGTLWEGRHKASLVDAEYYLLACYRYIELNPVRASMVLHPADYRWSSYRVNAGIQARRQLTPHECYQRLGVSDQERFNAYQVLFLADLGKDWVKTINRALEFSMPLGGSRFHQQIEKALGRKLGQSYRGRPKKTIDNSIKTSGRTLD
jgi:putative transposase